MAVNNNPYRILGVYVGSSAAVENRNLSRIAAYARVGQQAEFNLEADRLFEQIDRTPEAAAEAAQILSLPDDRIFYALQWFSDGTTEWGMILNQAVISLIENRLFDATCFYSRLIGDNELREEFVKAITHGIRNYTRDELCDNVIRILRQSPGFETMLNLGNLPGNCIIAKLIESDYIPMISELIASLDEKSTIPVTNEYNFYKTFDMLCDRTYELLPKLNMVANVLGIDDMRYMALAEEIVTKIYTTGADIITHIGAWTWNIGLKSEEENIFKSSRTRIAVHAALKLMDRVATFVRDSVAAIRLGRDSTAITYPELTNFENTFNTYFTNDKKVIFRSWFSKSTERWVINAIWLGVICWMLFL